MHKTRNTANGMFNSLQGTGAAPSFVAGTAVPDSLIEIMKNNPIPLEPVLKIEGQRTIKFAQPKTVENKNPSEI